MDETMYFPYILSAYVVAVSILVILLLTSVITLRKASDRLEALKKKRK